MHIMYTFATETKMLAGYSKDVCVKTNHKIIFEMFYSKCKFLIGIFTQRKRPIWGKR